MFDFYKKDIENDILVKIFDEKGNYSIASKNDPEPEGFIHHPDHDLRGWEKISRDEAKEILGYDPAPPEAVSGRRRNDNV